MPKKYIVNNSNFSTFLLPISTTDVTVGDTLYRSIDFGGTVIGVPSALGVVDSLDNTAQYYALSANQGRVLNSKFASYLPLSGGTITGAINFTSQLAKSGNAVLSTANIINNVTSSSSVDTLCAAQGKALNDKFASYLPLTGGTMTGSIKLVAGDNSLCSSSGSLEIKGSNSTTDTPSVIKLYNKTNGGRFELWGLDAYLIGYTDGTLQFHPGDLVQFWDNYPVLYGSAPQHKYLHTFRVYDSTTQFLCGTFINDVSTAYTTIANLGTALYNLGYNGVAYCLGTCGNASGGNYSAYQGVYGASGALYYCNHNGWYNASGWGGINDMVTQIM